MWRKNKKIYEELMQIAEQTDVDIITSGCIRDYRTSTFELYENVRSGLYTQEKLTDKNLFICRLSLKVI